MLRDFARSFAGAILAIVVAPIIFVAGPPLAALACVRLLHWRQLVARGHRDRETRFELEDVRSARAWRRDDADDDSHVLLELMLADGRRVVRADDRGELGRELSRRGLTVAERFLGTDNHASMLVLAWIYAAALIAFVAIVLAVLTCQACRP